jgi:ABC-type antimicrobial peptide transport system permease subunit
VVALRSLGLAIGDALIDNIRNSLHGDILLTYASDSPFSALNDREGDTYSPRDVQLVADWTAEQGGIMSTYIEVGNFQVTRVDAEVAGRPQFLSAILMDPQTFPPTGDIYALEPEGVPLRELFTGEGYEIVISANFAYTEGIDVGDMVRVSGTTEEFIVRGIVATENEASIQNLFASFFGFVYLPISYADMLQVDPNPNRISIALPYGADIEAALLTLPDIADRTRSVPELVETFSQISDVISDFIVILGLGALLIGGVGIINTMLVLVRRRTEEIAALKTFGLKGRQVASLFLAEAFLLGLAGSIFGCIAGVLLSGAVNSYGEAFLQQRLTWRVYPDALAHGFVLGMATSLVFGLVPVLLTLRVRPAIILRPNETHIPTMGVLQSLLALMIIVVSIGVMAGQIIGNMTWGMIGVAATLALLGLLVGVLWVVVWLVGKLPTFGSVDLRLALRNLSTRRVRTATTLLALSAGMFALSSITLVGQGVSEVLRFHFRESLGGNVLVVSLGSFVAPDLTEDLLDLQLAALPGVQYTTRNYAYGGQLTLINGEEPQIVVPRVRRSIGTGSLQYETRVGPVGFPLSARVSDNPNLTNGTLIAGRDLTPADEGQPVMVVLDGIGTRQIGIEVGDRVTMRVEGRSYEFEVVGIVSQGLAFFGAAFVPPGSLGNLDSQFQFTTLQIDEASLNDALLMLSEIPFVYAVDVNFIDGLVTRLIDQLSAVPTAVGLLSLMAAAVIMANTVALATLERRRQIGILKAIGLKGQRVLWVMLLENTLVGILGGLLGIGLSAIFMAVGTTLTANITIVIPQDSRLIIIGLAIASVLIAWLATFLSARVAIRERVLNVLRYE